MRTINTDINPNVSNSSKEIAAAVNSAGMNYYLFLVLVVCTYLRFTLTDTLTCSASMFFYITGVSLVLC